MAQLLQLEVSQDDDAVLAETKRRIWWTLYLIDRWASAGLGLPFQFKVRSSAPQLPMDEYEFRKLQPGQRLPDSWLWKPGLWAHMITLVEIFGQIQDLNKSLVQPGGPDLNDVELTVEVLAKQLLDFEEKLQPELRCSLENLKIHASKGLGRTFVALHLGYHHYATLLYYQYLDRHLTPTPQVRQYAERCKYHAVAFCDLIHDARLHDNTEAVYMIVGHMTVVSSSVLLHTLLFGNDEELPLSRQRLESNFETLIILRQYWPSLEQTVSDIQSDAAYPSSFPKYQSSHMPDDR
jgi:hypothetical protein